MKWPVAVAVAGLALLWGSEWMLLPALRWLPPLVVAFWSCALSAAALLPFLARALWRRGASRWLPSAALTGVLLFAAPVLLQLAPVRTASGVWAVAMAAVPLLTVLFLREPEAVLAPCVVGMGGVAFLVAEALEFNAEMWTGALVGLGRAAIFAAGLALAWRRMKEAPVAAAVCVQMAAAAAVFGAAALRWRVGEAHWGTPERQALAGLAAVALVGALLLLWLVGQRGPVAAGAVLWSSVAVTVAESAVVFEQRPGWEMVAGAALAVGAMVWLLRARGEADKTLTLWMTEA